jgi:hypothetical protein
MAERNADLSASCSDGFMTTVRRFGSLGSSALCFQSQTDFDWAATVEPRSKLKRIELTAANFTPQIYTVDKRKCRGTVAFGRVEGAARRSVPSAEALG